MAAYIASIILAKWSMHPLLIRRMEQVFRLLALQDSLRLKSHDVCIRVSRSLFCVELNPHRHCSKTGPFLDLQWLLNRLFWDTVHYSGYFGCPSWRLQYDDDDRLERPFDCSWEDLRSIFHVSKLKGFGFLRFYRPE